MHKLEFSERKNLIELFRNPTSAIILAALYTDIGEAWISGQGRPYNGIIFVENTFYVGGELIEEKSFEFLMEQILSKGLPVCHVIPQGSRAVSCFDGFFNREEYKGIVTKSERHLMDIDMKHLNHETLRSFTAGLPEEYQLRDIDETLFTETKNNGDTYNYIKLFKSFEDFEQKGFGFFIMKNREIIGGISSYARYEKGVEVQIAVKEEYRGQHLARSLGAKFILECEQRDLYPWWDCANPVSEHIAGELGYVLKQVTPIYKLLRKTVPAEERPQRNAAL